MATTEQDIKKSLLKFMHDECEVRLELQEFKNNVIGRFPVSDQDRAEQHFDEVFVFEFVPEGCRVEDESPFEIIACPLPVATAAAMMLPAPTVSKTKSTKKKPEKTKHEKKRAAAKKKPAAKTKAAPATKKNIIDRIDAMLKDRLSKEKIRDVLSALEDVIVEELIDKKVDKFSISRVLAIEVDRSEDAAKLTARPLSRLKDLT